MKVCFGVKGDNLGKFIIIREGFLVVFKVVYIRGQVNCEKGVVGYGLVVSKWGCLINYLYYGIIFLGIFIIIFILFRWILFLCEKFI